MDYYVCNDIEDLVTFFGPPSIGYVMKFQFRKQIIDMVGFRGWGDDQVPLALLVCEQAKVFVDALPETGLLKTVSVFPTGRQSIQFERDDANDLYWEVEVYTDKVVCYGDIMTHNPEGVVMEMPAAVKWFLGGVV